MLQMLPKGKTSFKKGSIGRYAQTEIECFQSTCRSRILFAFLCAWSHAPDKEQYQNKLDHSLNPTNALVRQKRSTRVLCSFKWLLCYAYVQSVSDISSTTWEIHITSLCRLVQMQQNWIQKICCLLTLFPSRLRVSSAMHLLPGHKFRFRSRCQSHLVQTTSSTESWAIVVKIV